METALSRCGIGRMTWKWIERMNSRSLISFVAGKLAGLLLLAFMLAGCQSSHDISKGKNIQQTAASSYNDVLAETVYKHWLVVMEPENSPKRSTPAVKISFILYPDGHISDLKVIKSNVSESSTRRCAKAITDSVPFAPWTDEMIQNSKTKEGILRKVEIGFSEDRRN